MINIGKEFVCMYHRYGIIVNDSIKYALFHLKLDEIRKGTIDASEFLWDNDAVGKWRMLNKPMSFCTGTCNLVL